MFYLIASIIQLSEKLNLLISSNNSFMFRILRTQKINRYYFSNTFKTKKSENITTDIALLICEALDCDLADIVKIVRD